MLPSSCITVPDVQLSRFRFFMEELRSRMLSLTPSLTRRSRNGAEVKRHPCQFSYPLSFRGELSPVFHVNGSLHIAPLFPRSGPGESSSPMSQVVLRCLSSPTTGTRPASRQARHATLATDLCFLTAPSSTARDKLAQLGLHPDGRSRRNGITRHFPRGRKAPHARCPLPTARTSARPFCSS